MAGNTYNNNTRKNDSVNTSGLQNYNGDGFHQSTIEIGYWNKMINIKISPALEVSKRTQTERFDYTKTISVACAPAPIRLFAENVLEEVIKAYNAGDTMTAKGITVGLDNALVAGVKLEGDQLVPHITIMKKIDGGTMLPSEMISYQFQPIVFINSYDIGEGSATVDLTQALTAEIRDVQQVLITAANELRAAGAHAQAFNDRFLRAKLFGKDEANGAPYSNNTGNVFGGNRQSSGSSEPLDKSTLTNASSLSDFTDM